MGHTVRFIVPQFVKPYVQGNKNDANDAQAICEAVGRPHMRFVAVKRVEQQNIQALHRIRTELVQQRTAKVNQIRGLLAEYGLIMGQGVACLRHTLPDLIEDAQNDLSYAKTSSIWTNAFTPGIKPSANSPKKMPRPNAS